MSPLFSPFAMGALTLKNRIVIAPMCQYSAVNGEASDWHLMHLGHLALSGAALLIIEATAVEPEGRISAGDVGLWSDATEAALAKVLHSVRKYSAMPIAIQLAHAGRKASSNLPWEGAQLKTVEQGGARQRQMTQVHQVPIRGLTVHRRILAHGRDHDAVSQH